MNKSGIEISLVIPIYNEKENIIPLVRDIEGICQDLSYEILIINDGSTDGSLEKAKTLKMGNPRIRIVNFKRNYGQTAAMAAGIDYAQGEYIIPLDGDRQNDPADIPKLLVKIKEGYDVVSGWRKDRHDAFLTRKLPSFFANFIISAVTGVRLHDYGCTLKAYRASLIKNVQIHGEMHRFLPAWCYWLGGKITEVPVNHSPRTQGKSKYGLTRVFKVIIDLMTVKFFSGYLAKPNYVYSGSGFFFFLISLLALGFALFDKFSLNRFPNFRIPLLLFSGFSGLLAVFLFLMGFLAELLVRVYFAARDQKPYVVSNEDLA